MIDVRRGFRSSWCFHLTYHPVTTFGNVLSDNVPSGDVFAGIVVSLDVLPDDMFSDDAWPGAYVTWQCDLWNRYVGRNIGLVTACFLEARVCFYVSWVRHVRTHSQ